jgi:hypothetical protein
VFADRVPGGCGRVYWATRNEAISSVPRSRPETKRCLSSFTQNGGSHHAIHFESDLGSFAQQIPGGLAAGGALMTLLVAFLVCLSAAVFLAHAIDAYQAG